MTQINITCRMTPTGPEYVARIGKHEYAMANRSILVQWLAERGYRAAQAR